MAPPTRKNFAALIALLIARIAIISIITSTDSVNQNMPARGHMIRMVLQQILVWLEFEEGNILPLHLQACRYDHKLKKD
ncbi:hypothetical protein KCU98_g4475, partial [Aureobasidium melanogenum]